MAVQKQPGNPLIVPGKRRVPLTKEQWLKNIQKDAAEHVKFKLEAPERWSHVVLRGILTKFVGNYKWEDGTPFEAHFNLTQVVDDLMQVKEKITVDDSVAILARAKELAAEAKALEDRGKELAEQEVALDAVEIEVAQMEGAAYTKEAEANGVIDDGVQEAEEAAPETAIGKAVKRAKVKQGDEK